MAIVAVGNVLAGASVVSGTVHTFTFSGSAAAGTTLLGTVAIDAAGGVLPTVTVTDTAGNTWATDVQMVSGSTVSSTIFRARVTNPVSGGDTLTVTLSNSRTRVACTVESFTGIATTGTLDKTATGPGGSSSSLTTGTTATTTSADELLFGAFGYGSGRTFSAAGANTAGTPAETAAGSSDRATCSAWRTVAATGTYSVTATLNSASTYSSVIATYVAEAVVFKSDGDAGTGADAAATLTATLSAAETGTGAEAATSTATLSAADTGTGVEAATTSSTRTATETGTGTDTAGILAVAVGVSETSSAVDAAGALAAALAAVETGTATDDASVQLPVVLGLLGPGTRRTAGAGPATNTIPGLSGAARRAPGLSGGG